MESGKLVTFGLVGVGAYLAYRWYIGQTNASAPSAPSASQNALDQAYQKLKVAIAGDPNFTGSGDGASASPDHWNVYLKSVTGYDAPIGSLFPGDPTAAAEANARTSTVTAAAFWAKVAPSVKTSMGLSGVGLYGGLGEFMARVN